MMTRVLSDNPAAVYYRKYRAERRDDPNYRASTNAVNRRYRDANREKVRGWDRDRRLRLRQEVLSAYGEACMCCGETTKQFLSIDHINNDGAEHRRTIGSATKTMYQWLKKNNYPEGFQILCHNCNLAKGFYGQCPHLLKS